MKTVCRKLKLKKYRSELTEDICKETDGTNFLIVFSGGSCKYGDEYDVRRALEEDHIKKIDYIFDMNDRITIRRDIIIDTDEIIKGDK